MAKVLLIEDEPDIRVLLRSALEFDRHQVSEEGTAEGGIARALADAPDLILMDLSLGGGMDGLEATRRLRGQTAFDRTPIIALTAHVMRGEPERALAAGCDEHWPKPITDLVDFTRQVARVLAAGRPAGAARTGGGSGQD